MVLTEDYPVGPMFIKFSPHWPAHITTEWPHTSTVPPHINSTHNQCVDKHKHCVGKLVWGPNGSQHCRPHVYKGPPSHKQHRLALCGHTQPLCWKTWFEAPNGSQLCGLHVYKGSLPHLKLHTYHCVGTHNHCGKITGSRILIADNIEGPTFVKVPPLSSKHNHCLGKTGWRFLILKVPPPSPLKSTHNNCGATHNHCVGRNCLRVKMENNFVGPIFMKVLPRLKLHS